MTDIPSDNILRLFVYGSLMTGQCNENQLLPWLVRAVSAETRGQMRLRPDGYPALNLSEHGRLGSLDYAADLLLDSAPRLENGERIEGQVLWLHPGTRALPHLDEFEGFWPGQPSDYLRVALSVETEEGFVPCWTYVGGEISPSDWPRIERWPPPWFTTSPEPYQTSISGLTVERHEG